jgi:hypothetical protein
MRPISKSPELQFLELPRQVREAVHASLRAEVGKEHRISIRELWERYKSLFCEFILLFQKAPGMKLDPARLGRTILFQRLMHFDGIRCLHSNLSIRAANSRPYYEKYAAVVPPGQGYSGSLQFNESIA